MAHFAELDNQGTVLQVIVVDNQKIIDTDGNESESIGIEFCKSLFGSDTNWVQTSYNGNFRKNYAAIGDRYDQSLDAFIPPKPYSSWIFSEKNATWESPVGPEPILTKEERDQGLFYIWNEKTLSWTLS
jgi:hypothetical protein